MLAAAVTLGTTAACAPGGGAGPAASTSTTTSAPAVPEHPQGDPPAPSVAFDRAGADTALDVSLRNYVVLGVPSRIRGPKVWFTATVVGGRTHELEIVDADGDPVGAIPPFRASEGEQHLAVVLEPGTYTVHCLVRAGTRTHASMGMRQELVVDQPAAT